MSSRSRSRSGSRSPARKRTFKRGVRDESMSPIRTASGANLRTSKQYDSRGPKDFSRNYQYNNNYQNNYQQRNFNYNNRNFYNQRNNYGNRWNRGRGNYRGQWNNNWNYQGRRRYNSRNERSRSRSRSRSYERDRSRSRSDSRSRSRDRSRSASHDRHRRRSRSYSDRSKSLSRSKSRSKTPSKSKVEKNSPKQIFPEKVQERSPDPPPPGEEPIEIKKETEEMRQKHPNVASLSKSRWETPDPSPDRLNKEGMTRSSAQDVQLQQDAIFDQWDDDKLRAYLLKTNAKKLGREGLKMKNEAEEASAQQKQSGKKKKKKSVVESPENDSKMTRGRKKKRSSRRSRSSSTSSSSSSSSSWSPIHKAHGSSKSLAEDSNQSKKLIGKTIQHEYEPPNSQIYMQQQVYSSSAERTQAVTYPFSHIRKPAPTPAPPVQPVQAPVPQYPVPVPAPQPVQTPLPGLGDLHIIGPDGNPVKLVQMSVSGPDGKIMQVMQIQPTSAATVVPASTAATGINQAYRTPPPPPSYPPPTVQTNIGKYVVSSSAPMYEKMPEKSFQPITELKPISAETPAVQQTQNLPPYMKVVQTVDEDIYSSERQTDVKKIGMIEKQKRRQEVLRTRFKPRPAPASSTWIHEEIKEKNQKKDEKQKPWISLKSDKKKTDHIPGFDLNDQTGKDERNNNTATNMERTYGIPTLSSEHDFKANESAIATPATQSIQTVNSNLQIPDKQKSIPISSSHVLPHSQPTTESNVKPQQQGSYFSVPPQLAAQGFKAVYGNPQLLVGPNGEMLQLLSGPPAVSQPQPISAPPLVETTIPHVQADAIQKKPDGWTTAAEEFIRGKPELQTNRQEDSSSSEEEEFAEKIEKRKRTISGGSEKKAKKKTRAGRSTSIGEGDEQQEDAAANVKRKKEAKKKKKKNKKKKAEAELSEESPVKEKKKKKKQKEKIQSVELESLKSKKDLKGFNEAKKKSKNDNLIRYIADDLPLSHIRAIVPRHKSEGTQVLLGHVNFDTRTTSSLATSTSYEERFVSLFGSGEAENTNTSEGKIDITKKSVRKFKVHVQGTRSVSHMTSVCLSDRIKESEKKEKVSTSQKVSLNVSSLSKMSTSFKESRSRSASRSSSASSESAEHSRRHYSSRSKSKSKSRSRSISLPLAYSVSDKPSRREVIPARRHSPFGANDRSRSREYSDNDLRQNIEKRKLRRDYGSKSRSRSLSSNEDRDRGQHRQPYNRNQQYHNNYNYNQRGRGQYNNRGYYNYRGRRGYNNNYQNRGNFRGRYQNWNQQGYNNRNQNYRYQKYDNRDDHYNRSSERYEDRDMSPDRSRNRDNRSSSRERESKYVDKSPVAEKKAVEEFPFKQKDQESDQMQKIAGDGNKVNPAGIQTKRNPSPAQWTHDMFEKQEMEEIKEQK